VLLVWCVITIPNTGLIGFSKKNLYYINIVVFQRGHHFDDLFLFSWHELEKSFFLIYLFCLFSQFFLPKVKNFPKKLPRDKFCPSWDMICPAIFLVNERAKENSIQQFVSFKINIHFLDEQSGIPSFDNSKNCESHLIILWHTLNHFVKND
jgi:hypothetical protein